MSSNAAHSNSPMTAKTRNPADIKRYQGLIGVLLYIARNTRPDILSTVTILSQKASRPTQENEHNAEKVFGYLKKTKGLKFKIGSKEVNSLNVFCDADWASDKVDRKSISAAAIYLGESLVIWKSKKQTSISLSSMEAEFVAIAEACKEVMWLRNLFKELNLGIEPKPIVNADNQAAISYAEGQSSNKAKHIDLRFKFVQDLTKNKIIKIQYVKREINIADCLTKSYNKLDLKNARRNLNLTQADDQSKGRMSKQLRTTDQSALADHALK